MSLKVLIADDEELERRALRRFLHELDDIRIVGEARNGLEAVHLAREHRPDLALLDIKMPGMSGLEAMREISAFLPHMRTIIVTAYEDFAFAQEALKLGAVDYLLKPVPPDQVQSTVQHIVRVIRREQQREQEESRVRAELQAAAPFVQRALVLDLISGSGHDPAALAEQAARVGLTHLPTVALAVGIDNGATGGRGSADAQRHQLKQQVLDAITRVIGDRECCLAIPMGGDDLVVVFGPPASDLVEALELAEQLRARVEQTTPATVTVGIGGSAQAPGQLSDSYQDALTAVRLGRLFMGTNRVIHAAEVVRPEDTPEPGLLQQEKELAERVRWGDLQGATAAAIQLLDEYLGPRGPAPDMLRMRLMELAVVLSRAAADGGGDGQKALSTTGPMVVTLQECRTADEFRRWLQGGVEFFVGLVTEGYSTNAARLVKRVTDYIDAQFSQPLTVGDMARQVYLNPSYFARIFKTHTGMTFVDYLTQRRIDQARNLLAATDDPVSSIARQVGYQDPNYFTRIFTRVAGVSPKDFRRQLDKHMAAQRG